LGAYCKHKGFSFSLQPGKSRGIVFASGILMSVHWVAYFFALVHTSVAVSMLAIFTYPMITTLLEPLVLDVKLQTRSVLLSALVLLGIYLLLPTFSLENSDTKGFLFAILSAVTYSIRNLMMKREIELYNGSILMYYQCLISVIILIPFFFVAAPSIEDVVHDLPFLFGLAFITTCLGHTIFLYTFKHFRISTASILSSFQPVFGIILAAFFLNEFPSWRTVFGGAIILITVLIESIISSRRKAMTKT
jgi:drug/metabolite transporter (DMT)-like permease